MTLTLRIPLSSIVSAMVLVLTKLSASGQIIVDVGNISLNPNQSGQIVDIFIKNNGLTPVSDLGGLNFVMQIGNGLSGPQVQSVSLHDTTSIFSAFSGTDTDQGSTPWIRFQGVDASVALSLPAQSSTLLASVTLDTTGISFGSGPWPLTLDATVNQIHSATEYVLFSNGASRSIDTINNGLIAVVPEPAALVTVMGLLLIGVAGFRTWRKRPVRNH